MKELATFEAERATAKAETEATLVQMKSIAVDTILHPRAKLMEEYKARQHIGWDLDYEIRVWEEREVVLARFDEDDVTAEGKSTPLVESLRLVATDKEVDQTMEDAGPKELVEAAECPEESLKEKTSLISWFCLYIFYLMTEPLRRHYLSYVVCIKRG